MSPSFASRLSERIRVLDNPSVLGLDPRREFLPETLLLASAARGFNGAEQVAEAFGMFNRAILDALQDCVACVKFQSACYEQYGMAGIRVLAESIDYAKSLGYLTILDAKRNDIGSSAEAYALASIGQSPLSDGYWSAMDADAVTINAYLGWDGVKPFLEQCRERGKGCFVLVRTSNPSAVDLQDLVLHDGRKVYEAMADLVAAWSLQLDPDEEFSSLGAVVGATWPNEAKALRSRMPRQYFLIPGYGAQGAGAADAVAGFASTKGGLVNSSRGIMLAWKKQGRPEVEFAEGAREEALRMRDDLREALIHA